MNDVGGNSNKVLDKVLKQGGRKLWQESVRAYLANSTYADAAIGHLLESLYRSDYAQNTIVVLWGDHGWHLGEKKHYQKFTVWERASKTTFVIYDPIDGRSGRVDHAVSLQDIYPTLIDLAALPQPEFAVRGRSLKPLVRNPESKWSGAAMMSLRGSHGIFSDRYHYIENKNGKTELYDLDKDPNEWHNLTHDNSYSKVKKQMASGLEAMMKEHNENPFEGVHF